MGTNYDTSPVEARTTPDGSHVELGVTVGGAWFPFRAYPAENFTASMQAAQDAQASQPDDSHQ